MNIQNKIQNWNEVLLQADKKVKEVVDQATGQYYFEVAEYKNDNSVACKVINMIKEKTGKDWRFSFLNIDKVIFTTKHECNLEDFIKDYRFDINTENFAYSNVTVKEFDAIKRSNALDKVMAKELPINLEALNHIHAPFIKSEYSSDLNESWSKITSEDLNKDKYQSTGKSVTDHKLQGLATKKEATQDNGFNSMLEQLSTGVSNDSIFGHSQKELSKVYPEKEIKEMLKTQTFKKVELDDFAKELVAEFSKPEHKNTVKIVKSKDLGRGR